MRIATLAERAHLPARTVRFYADTGLLKPALRGENGYRFFGPDAIERVHLLRRASELGVPLREIAKVLAVAEGADCTDAHQAFAAALRQRIAEVDRQVRELAATRDQLVDLAAESDMGCSDAFCLCRTKPGEAVPIAWDAPRRSA